MTEATLNSSYLIEEDGLGQSYPALQAETYQPANLKATVRMGFSEDSFDLLCDEAKAALKAELIEVCYGEADVNLMVPTAEVRWVIVGRPGLFVYDKDADEYSHLTKGMKFAGTKKVTAARLYLACICDGAILTDGDGEPQLFTLKLTSSKTALLGGARSQPGDGSIESLNRGLCKHYGAKGWLTHLVSVDLQAKPEKFTQRNGGESSLGIRFVLNGNARILPDVDQKTMFEFCQRPDIRQQVKDPFGLSGEPAAVVTPAPAVEPDVSYDQIPF